MKNHVKKFPSQEIDRLLMSCKARIGVYLKDLNSGVIYEHAADDLFPTASICKVPVMVELFNQAHQGRISLDDRRRLEGPISIWGGGMLPLLRNAPEFTLRDYCLMMIARSEDMATDLLMGVLGLDAINATMDKLGFQHTRVNMTMGQWHALVCDMQGVLCNHENHPQLLKKYYSGHRNWDTVASRGSLKNNVTSPREMGDIIEKIHLGQIISGEASAQMLDILKKCTSRNMIPRDLQPQVQVAHKIGSGCGVKGDVGMVYLPSGPLLVSAMLFSKTGGSDWIGDVARLAVQALSPDSVAQEQ